MSTQFDQLPLHLELPKDYSRASFLEGPANAAALTWIEKWPDWPQNTLSLSGGRGAGKTHLAHISAKHSGATFVKAAMVHNLNWRNFTHFIMEDGPPEPKGEEVLFHIINWVRECGGSLLITGKEPPATWDIALPDCASRLRAIVNVKIEEPDDTLIQQLLVKSFEQKGAHLPLKALEYILARVDRSFDGVKSCVWRVNYLALVKKAPITTALVRQAMGW